MASDGAHLCHMVFDNSFAYFNKCFKHKICMLLMAHSMWIMFVKLLHQSYGPFVPNTLTLVICVCIFLCCILYRESLCLYICRDCHGIMGRLFKRGCMILTRLFDQTVCLY